MGKFNSGLFLLFVLGAFASAEFAYAITNPDLPRGARKQSAQRADDESGESKEKCLPESEWMPAFKKSQSEIRQEIDRMWDGDKVDPELARSMEKVENDQIGEGVFNRFFGKNGDEPCFANQGEIRKKLDDVKEDMTEREQEVIEKAKRVRNLEKSRCEKTAAADNSKGGSTDRGKPTEVECGTLTKKDVRKLRLELRDALDNPEHKKELDSENAEAANAAHLSLLDDGGEDGKHVPNLVAKKQQAPSDSAECSGSSCSSGEKRGPSSDDEPDLVPSDE